MNRQQNMTSLMSGEGPADRNFLKYLHAVYCHGATRHHVITIHGNNRDGHTGGSSDWIIQEAMRACDNRCYHNIVVLLDGDILPSKTPTELINCAKRKVSQRIRQQLPPNIGCVIVTPCLEALLLNILGHTVPSTSKECKLTFHKIFGRPAHEVDYAAHFPRKTLDKACHSNYALNRLVSFLLLEGFSPEVTDWFQEEIKKWTVSV